LVALSIQHGIITPYTSFLADDQAGPSDLANVRRNQERTELSLRRLSEADTAAGFRQRASKKSLQDAYQLPTARPSSRLTTGGRGYAENATAGGVVIQSIDSDEESVSDAVINVGKETIYRRGKTLIVSNARDVDLEKDKDQIVEIERYSDEYFTLVATNSKSDNAVLARQAEGQEMIIRLRGKVYRIK
jgi:Ca-activated chloride channel family protein